MEHTHTLSVLLSLDPTCNDIHSSVRRCTDQDLRSCHVQAGRLRGHAIALHKGAGQVSGGERLARPRGALDHRERLLQRHLDSLLLVHV